MARSKRRGGGGVRGGAAVKVTPNLASDPEGTRAVNLSVLRRLDPDVADILITASHVVVYTFDVDAKEWVLIANPDSCPRAFRAEPEPYGGVALRRQEKHRAQIPICHPESSKYSTENLVEAILTDFEVELQVPYVIYRGAADEIVGIWFYDPQECEEVGHLFCSVIEEQEGAAGPSALPGAEGTLEQPTSPTIEEDDVEEFLLTPSNAATFVDTSGRTCAVQPNQSSKTIPSSSHESHDASASQASALHSLLPSRTSSATLRPFDAHTPHGPATIQPASVFNLKLPLLAPMASTQSTIANAASSLYTVPPLHDPFASHRPQSAPLLHPFPPLPTVAPAPRYGMPLLQSFPPPDPLPFVTPSASYSQVLTREQVGAALLRLAQNDAFIDMVYQEMIKRPYP
ncbi:hypothetical protein U9M48_011106 [Paspalum notatum var. saurae]|uniref:mRNA-decapping enzyme-like protein n=1 Tax=Paspalum notatum var. saurae TaxID=547442 RepID=A0AAQ3WH15_PASNO